MNLTFANKNPFSTFDFLGYFFPGALFMFLFYVLTKGTCEGDMLAHLPVISHFGDIMKANVVIGVFLLVLISYIIGHLLSYMSSITIELFYTWYYGYPTKYLLRKENDTHDPQYLLNSKLGIWGMIGHLVVCLLLFPILVGHFIFERLFHMKSFICRNLDDKLIDSISEKIKLVCDSIGYSNAKSNDADIHRVVMHYVYEHCRMHQVKFDNYVALYGLLRSVSFTFCLSFLFVLCRLLFHQEISVVNKGNCIDVCTAIVISLLVVSIIVLSVILKKEKIKNKENEKAVYFTTDILLCLVVSTMIVYVLVFIFMTSSKNINVDVLMLCSLFFATYLSYLGFAKFYRRFTLENFMALLICEQPKEVDNTINLKTDDSLNIRIDHPTSLTSEIFRFLADRSNQSK